MRTTQYWTQSPTDEMQLLRFKNESRNIHQNIHIQPPDRLISSSTYGWNWCSQGKGHGK